MRRMLWPVCAGVIAGLSAPTAASAGGVLDTFRRLAERGLSPAPLVPTTAPPSLRPVDRTLEGVPSSRRSGYGVRLAGRNAIIAISGGDYANMKAARRDFKGYRTRSI